MGDRQSKETKGKKQWEREKGNPRGKEQDAKSKKQRARGIGQDAKSKR